MPARLHHDMGGGVCKFRVQVFMRAEANQGLAAAGLGSVRRVQGVVRGLDGGNAKLFAGPGSQIMPFAARAAKRTVGVVRVIVGLCPALRARDAGA